jgi:hypothetical protein
MAVNIFESEQKIALEHSNTAFVCAIFINYIKTQPFVKD